MVREESALKKLMAALLGVVLVGWASWGAEPVRVGVFTGAGACSVGMLRWIQIACRSPELTQVKVKLLPRGETNDGNHRI